MGERTVLRALVEIKNEKKKNKNNKKKKKKNPCHTMGGAIYLVTDSRITWILKYYSKSVGKSRM